jgi:hypothetical protein
VRPAAPARFGPQKTQFMPRFSQFSRWTIEQDFGFATLQSFARPFAPARRSESPTLLQFRPKDSIMRIASVLTLIAAAAVSSAASAAPANTNVDATVAKVAVSAHGTYKPSQSELEDVRGTYALEDGRTLLVNARQNHLYADLGGGRIEIVPVARNAFASRDDAVRVVFNSSDDPTEVKVSTAQ